MRRIRKYALAGCLAVALLAAVFIALILGSRWLTGSDAVREKIVAETARYTGGQLHYTKLALHLLPLPHLTALQVDFLIPGTISLKTAALAIYPDLAALVGGSFRLDALVIVRPATRIVLTRAPAKVDPPAKAAPEKAFRETLATVFGALSRLGPELEIKVKDGAVDLVRPDKPELKIDLIDLELNGNGQGVALDLRCRSDISGRMTFKGSVNRETRSSEGRLKLDGLNARALLAELPPVPGITLSDTSLGLEVVFRAEAAEKVQARISCKVPDIRIQREARSLALQKILLEGDIAADPQKLVWDIKSLKIDSQGLDLGSSGTLTFGSRTHPAALELEAAGRRIDVAAVARSFTDFAGDQDWVQTVFKVAREGVLTKATCRLVAHDSETGWIVPEITATGNLDKGLITIPGAELDLENVSGNIILENRRVDFKQMQGRLPYGVFEKVAARIDWHQVATLEVSTPRATVQLESFYPWLAAFEGLQDLRKFVSTAEGELAFTQLEIAGPLTVPVDWKIEIGADVKNVTLTSPELSGPMRLLRGRAGFKPRTLVLEKLHMQYLDADTVSSCKILGQPGQPELMHLSLDGAIGAQALSWGRRFLDMPEHLRIQPPLKVTGMDLQWNDRGSVAVTGEITTGGARLLADAAFAPDHWRINRFELDDGISNVSLKLTKSDQHVDLVYSGKLHKATLDRVLKENTTLKGWVAGKLQGSLDMYNLQSSTITGTLRGEGVIVQRLPVSPIEFERFALDCRGKTVRLESADIVFAETPMRLMGTAGIGAQAYTFDLDLAADSLDAAALGKIQKVPSARAETPETDTQEKLPINGVIRFKTPRFTFKDFTWSPVHADITVQSDNVKVTATRADLCGISTPGSVTIKPDGLHLSFKPVAVEKNLQATWECLQSKPLRADSLYSLNGTIEARGPANDLVKNLEGDISFSSDNGMIHRANLLTKIFSFVNLTEVFAGKVSGVGEKGFGYDALRAHAAIKAGVVNFDEILVDGHSMKISGLGTVNLVDNTLGLDLLVAPLKTFDRIVKKMPVIGYITDGSVLSVPVRIKGSTADPQVVPLPPAAVGRGLTGILERTLKAPLKVVESLPRNDPQKPLPGDRAGETGPASQ